MFKNNTVDIKLIIDPNDALLSLTISCRPVIVDLESISFCL